MRQLKGAAMQGRTIPLEELSCDGPVSVVQYLLTAVDRGPSADVALLSSLVTQASGDPVSFFRSILERVNLAVPRTDEALLLVWKREQDRAFAAYASPPRPLPPRLVPKVSV
ncbi:hypothetical protein [Streptomyces sp. NPDC046939]|uniref:hypothetical protein n=1 Tax=Streptomyces sp. NPDC046939 TaxID=3155376 RepID=UPI003400F65B